MGDRLATIGMGRKWGGAAVAWAEAYLFTKWQLDPSNRLVTAAVAWAEAYLFTKWHLDPSNRLATTVGMPRFSA